MLKQLSQWAIAILAVALFFSLLLNLVPFWSFYSLLIFCGIISACVAARIVLTQPRSQERFHALCHSLSASAMAIAFGAVGLFGQFDIGIDSRVRSRASMVMYLSLPVCLMAYFAWYQHASKNYGDKPSHPDFGEDDEGNPSAPVTVDGLTPTTSNTSAGTTAR